MIRKLYVIIDRVTQDIGIVMQFPNNIAATRFFTDIAENKQPGNEIVKHLADHELRCVGYIDTETGKISVDDQLPATVITGQEVIDYRETLAQNTREATNHIAYKRDEVREDPARRGTLRDPRAHADRMQEL